LRYGLQYYGCQEVTFIFVAPGQVFRAEDDGTHVPTYWPSADVPSGLLRDTPLPGAMKQDFTLNSTLWCGDFQSLNL